MTMKLVHWVAALAVYFLAPSYLPLAGYVLIMILFALSLDLIVGYGGIVTLGHSAYFGVGAEGDELEALRAGLEPAERDGRFQLIS